MSASNFALRLGDVRESLLPGNIATHKGSKMAWPILSGMSLVLLEIPAESSRSPHYHLNTGEVVLVANGSVRAGLVDTNGHIHEFDLNEGDCGFFPGGWIHWLQNTHKKSARLYVFHSHEQPVTVEVSKVLHDLERVSH